MEQWDTTRGLGDLGRKTVYFLGSGYQAKPFGVLGSREKGSKENIKEMRRNAIILSGSRKPRPHGRATIMVCCCCLQAKTEKRLITVL